MPPAPVVVRLGRARSQAAAVKPGTANVWLTRYVEDVAVLLRLVESLSNRILAAHEVLAMRAERKDCRRQ